MSTLARLLGTVFAAGAFGGLVNSLVVWASGKLELTAALGVKIAPALTPAWLYPRLVWGGIWGGLFILPLLRGSVAARGLLFSLGPTAAQLFFFSPRLGQGVLGLKQGDLTPLFVLAFNAVWGLATAWWLRQVERSL